MKNKLLFLFLIPFFISGCILSQPPVKEDEQKQIKTDEQIIPVEEVISPAAVYCKEQGGTIKIEKREQGDYGICILPDGTECEEWDYFKGICPKKIIKKQEEKINPNEFDDLVAKYSKAIIKTSLGDIKIEFYSNDSPITVNNFLNLANKGFYDNTKFHRVIKNFMIQGGDPNSKDNDWTDDGMGGPGYLFKDEINKHKLVKGSFAMANSGPNTNGSQFFIVSADKTPHLDGLHTNFGYVINGIDVVEKIEQTVTGINDHPKNDIIIKNILLE